MARLSRKAGTGSQARKRITFNDIARKAGVSKTTVSLVLSGRPGFRISEATSARVRTIAEELGYIPSQLGKGFLQRKSRIIGVVMSYAQYSPWLEGYAAIQHELSRAGYVAIAMAPTWKLVREGGRKRRGRLVSSEFDDFRRLLEYQIDGLLYHSLNSEYALEVLSEAERHKLPTVMMGSLAVDPPVDYVGCDERKVGGIVARHLLFLGLKTYAAAE